MKISELISDLQATLQEYGDLACVWWIWSPAEYTTASARYRRYNRPEESCLMSYTTTFEDLIQALKNLIEKEQWLAASRAALRISEECAKRVQQ